MTFLWWNTLFKFSNFFPDSICLCISINFIYFHSLFPILSNFMLKTNIFYYKILILCHHYSYCFNHSNCLLLFSLSLIIFISDLSNLCSNNLLSSFNYLFLILITVNFQLVPHSFCFFCQLNAWSMIIALTQCQNNFRHLVRGSCSAKK